MSAEYSQLPKDFEKFTFHESFNAAPMTLQTLYNVCEDFAFDSAEHDDFDEHHWAVQAQLKTSDKRELYCVRYFPKNVSQLEIGSKAMDILVSQPALSSSDVDDTEVVKKQKKNIQFDNYYFIYEGLNDDEEPVYRAEKAYVTCSKTALLIHSILEAQDTTRPDYVLEKELGLRDIGEEEALFIIAEIISYSGKQAAA